MWAFFIPFRQWCVRKRGGKAPGNNSPNIFRIGQTCACPSNSISLGPAGRASPGGSDFGQINLGWSFDQVEDCPGPHPGGSIAEAFEQLFISPAHMCKSFDVCPRGKFAPFPHLSPRPRRVRRPPSPRRSTRWAPCPGNTALLSCMRVIYSVHLHSLIWATKRKVLKK